MHMCPDIFKFCFHLGKRSLGPQAPGPSEESVDRRLEGHAHVVSELLQSVAANMANELPLLTGVKNEDANNQVPKKRQQQQIQQQQQQLQPAQQQQLPQQLQQVLLQSPSSQSGQLST